LISLLYRAGVDMGEKFNILLCNTIQNKEACMKLSEVKEIAHRMGIPTRRSNKANIIKSIQRYEGNFDCFGTATDGYCDQYMCLWRDDCLKSSKRAQ